MRSKSRALIAKEKGRALVMFGKVRAVMRECGSARGRGMGSRGCGRKEVVAAKEDALAVEERK